MSGVGEEAERCGRMEDDRSETFISSDTQRM